MNNFGEMKIDYYCALFGSLTENIFDLAFEKVASCKSSTQLFKMHVEQALKATVWELDGICTYGDFVLTLKTDNTSNISKELILLSEVLLAAENSFIEKYSLNKIHDFLEMQDQYLMTDKVKHSPPKSSQARDVFKYLVKRFIRNEPAYAEVL